MGKRLIFYGCLFLFGCAGGTNPSEVFNAPVATLAITDSPSYDFGSQLVDSRTDKAFTITNTGMKEATQIFSSFNLSVNFAFLGGNYPGEGGTCGVVLGVGETCRVVVRFQPRYVGSIEEVLKISFFDGSRQQTTSAPKLKAKGIWDTPANPDTTWASGGKISFPISRSDDTGQSVWVQSDGKILMSGSIGSASGEDFYVQRLLSDGTPDPSFGSEGKRVLQLSTGDSSLETMVQATDGKILLAGRNVDGGNAKWALARLHNDGSDDTAWGGNGRVLTEDPLGNLSLGAVAVLADRGVLVAGSRETGGQKDVALARYLADGSLDNTFGVQGRVVTAVSSGDDMATDFIFLDGKIFVGGWSDRDFLLLRYSWDGQLESTVQLDLNNGSTDRAQVVRLQADRKILLAGFSDNGKSDFAAARFLSDGTLDTTFGNSGKTILSLGSGNDLITAAAIQSDKKILLAGRSSSDLGVARLLPNGTLDTLFGLQGRLVWSLGSGDDRLNGLALQGSGKILLVGESFTGNDFDPFLARLWP